MAFAPAAVNAPMVPTMTRRFEVSIASRWLWLTRRIAGLRISPDIRTVLKHQIAIGSSLAPVVAEIRNLISLTVAGTLEWRVERAGAGW